MRSVPVSRHMIKCPFERRYRRWPVDNGGYEERYAAQGRVATIGHATCRRCRRTLRWLDSIFFDDFVWCRRCNAMIGGIGFAGILRARHPAWRDEKGLAHIVSVDLEQNSITACKRPATHNELSSGRLIEASATIDVFPTCLVCVTLPLAA